MNTNRCFLALLFAAALLPSLVAQELTSREVYGNFVFARDGQIITLNEMIAEQPSGTELGRLFRSGRRNQFWSSVLGFSGSLVLGLALAEAIDGDNSEDNFNHWSAYVICAAMIGASFPLRATADRRIIEATRLYNESPPIGHRQSRGVEGYVGATGAGVGVGVRF